MDSSRSVFDAVDQQLNGSRGQRQRRLCQLHVSSIQLRRKPISKKQSLTRRLSRAARPWRASTSSAAALRCKIFSRASSPICASASALLVHSQPNSVPSVPHTMRSAPYKRTAASIAPGPKELQSTYTFARRKRDDGSSSVAGVQQRAVIHALDLVGNIAAEIVHQDRRIGVRREVVGETQGHHHRGQTRLHVERAVASARVVGVAGYLGKRVAGARTVMNEHDRTVPVRHLQ